MKRRRPLPLFFGLSVILHGAVFLFSPGFRSSPALPKTEQRALFSLIDIAVLEPGILPAAEAVEGPAPVIQIPAEESAAAEESSAADEEALAAGELSPPPDAPVWEEGAERLQAENARAPENAAGGSEDAVTGITGGTKTAGTPEEAAGVVTRGAEAGVAGDTKTAGASADAGRNPPEEPALAAAYIRHNFEIIRRRIGEKLAYPSRARRTGSQGRAEAVFTIHRDGSVSDVWIRISSGQEILDKAIVEAVYAAAPFPPPPVQTKIAAPVSFRLR